MPLLLRLSTAARRCPPQKRSKAGGIGGGGSGGGSAGSLFSRAISSLISVDAGTTEGGGIPAVQANGGSGGAGVGGGSSDGPSPEAAAAADAADGCRVGAVVVSDSKFLKAESLEALAAAVAQAGLSELSPSWMGGGGSGAVAASSSPPPASHHSPADPTAAEVCLELSLALASRNRDRLPLLWPAAHELISASLRAGPPSGSPPGSCGPLTRRAALAAVRSAAALLPSLAGGGATSAAGAAAAPLPLAAAAAAAAAAAPPSAAGAFCTTLMMRTLSLLARLPAAEAWELAPALAPELLSLVRAVSSPSSSSAPSLSPSALRRGRDWRLVLALLLSAASHPHAGGAAVAGVIAAASPGALSPASFPHVLAAALAVAEGRCKGAPVGAPPLAATAIEGMAAWLASKGAVVAAAAAASAAAQQQGALPPAATGASAAAAPLLSLSLSLAAAAEDDDDAPEPALSDLWAATARAAASLAAEGSASADLRDAAVAALAR